MSRSSRSNRFALGGGGDAVDHEVDPGPAAVVQGVSRTPSSFRAEGVAVGDGQADQLGVAQS